MKKRRAYTIGILGIAAIFLVIGIIDGQYQDVLKKAVTICLECVGIG